jgi:hypothetical protein
MSGWCNASRSFFERREKPPLPTGCLWELWPDCSDVVVIQERRVP